MGVHTSGTCMNFPMPGLCQLSVDAIRLCVVQVLQQSSGDTWGNGSIPIKGRVRSRRPQPRLVSNAETIYLYIFPTSTKII